MGELQTVGLSNLILLAFFHGIKAAEFTGAGAGIVGQNKSTDSFDGRNKSEVSQYGSEKFRSDEKEFSCVGTLQFHA